MDQLDRNGICGEQYTDLINDYMDMWVIKNKLLADGKKNPYTEWKNSESSYGRKKNDAIDQAVKVNKQMMEILKFLGIEPSKDPDNDTYGCDMEM